MVKRRSQILFIALICIVAVLAGCTGEVSMADTEEKPAILTTDNLTKGRNPEVNSATLGSIPEEYYKETEQGGTLETFSYECAAGSKNATVYLPYGYDEADSETKYDILYLLHGNGGNETTYLGNNERPTELKYILDQMIARQEIKPLIVVCPALNHQSSFFDNDEEGFIEEWRQSIVPAVEGHYHTYAATTDSEGLQDSRAHRMFGGFSAGSTTTWYSFIYDLDYISCFLNMSSDCWVLGMEGGRDHPEETAEYLANVARESGYGTNDYYIFAATGTGDHAYENLNSQIAAMKEKADVFHYSDNGFTVGNLTYYTVEGNKHDYPYTYEYIYNGLRSFASIMPDDSHVASESSSLVSTNGNYPPLENTPSEYENASEYGGTLQELSYMTKDYGGNKAERETSAMVYLPYGYDSDNADTKYNILYLMHGAYGNQYTYLGTESSGTRLKNILDHMIEKGDIDPVIVVAPYIPAGSDFYESTNANFYQELENDLMPAVEKAYRTYAETTTPEGFRDSRSHRAFAGFSMGGAATWFTFAHELDYFAYFLPMSGDYWIDGALTGGRNPEKTARELNRIAKDSGYGTQEYFIFAATGTADIAYTPEYNNMGEQIEAMKEQEAFDYTETGFQDGNFTFYLVEGNRHDYSYTYDYIFNGLRWFFRK